MRHAARLFLTLSSVASLTLAWTGSASAQQTGQGTDSDTPDDMLGHEPIEGPEEEGSEVEVAEEEGVEEGEEGEEIDAPPPPPPPPIPREAPPIPSAGEGSSGGASASTNIPINIELHGYYRARLVSVDAQPVAGDAPSRDETGHAAYGFMRLRLDPAVLFGSDRLNPVAALRMQIDALDNVVFGDNARLAGTPLFAGDPSRTSLIDGDLDTWFNLRRLWLEFLIPIGQIRIGRMASQGGLGLLFNDGNGFKNDFGDAYDGTSFDRVLFATRPISVVNFLVRGDARPTPLILALAYDWLAEDTLGVAGTAGERSRRPFQWVTGGEDDVWQTTLALVWRDEEFNDSVNARDELTVGLVMVHRGQDSTASNIYIGDFFYRLLWSPFGRRVPQLYSEGELYTIQGSTYGVALFGPGSAVDPNTGRTGNMGGANIWGGAARLGVEQFDNNTVGWAARVEGGFSTGQEGAITAIGSYEVLSQRPNNPAYQVGLLLYPLVLAVRTANTYQETFEALWSQGGVWNSIYILPQVRLRPFNWLEFIGQFLVAFADQVNQPLFNSHEDGSTGCGLSEECLLGWEADVAIKVSWGPNDEMRWTNEFGIMNAGPALGPRLSQSLLWTLQTRIAFVF